VDEDEGHVDGIWQFKPFDDTELDPEHPIEKGYREAIEKGRAEGWLE
jgi:hypothetical protein